MTSGQKSNQAGNDNFENLGNEFSLQRYSENQ